MLEYACPVWHLSLPQLLIDQIEHIQKRVLKIISPNLTYRESLMRPWFTDACRKKTVAVQTVFIKTSAETPQAISITCCQIHRNMKTIYEIVDILHFLILVLIVLIRDSCLPYSVRQIHSC